MSELERLLLNYYRSVPWESLTAQEKGELVFLEVKLALEEYEKKCRGTL